MLEDAGALAQHLDWADAAHVPPRRFSAKIVAAAPAGSPSAICVTKRATSTPAGHATAHGAGREAHRTRGNDPPRRAPRPARAAAAARRTRASCVVTLMQKVSARVRAFAIPGTRRGRAGKYSSQRRPGRGTASATAEGRSCGRCRRARGVGEQRDHRDLDGDAGEEQPVREQADRAHRPAVRAPARRRRPGPRRCRPSSSWSPRGRGRRCRPAPPTAASRRAVREEEARHGGEALERADPAKIRPRSARSSRCSERGRGGRAIVPAPRARCRARSPGSGRCRGRSRAPA